MIKRLLCAIAVVSLVGTADLAAQGGLRYGPQVSYADDADFGIGGRLEIPVPVQRLSIITSFDIFFPGNSVDYWEINGNAKYAFALAESILGPYLGAGLHLARASANGNGNTELGANILGGMEFDTGPVVPFAELRVELGGGEQFVLTGGLLF